MRGAWVHAWDLLPEGTETAVLFPGREAHMSTQSSGHWRRLHRAPACLLAHGSAPPWTAEAGLTLWPQVPTLCSAMARVPTSLLSTVSAALPWTAGLGLAASLYSGAPRKSMALLSLCCSGSSGTSQEGGTGSHGGSWAAPGQGPCGRMALVLLPSLGSRRHVPQPPIPSGPLLGSPLPWPLC